MSESWMQIISAAVLGWVAWEIRALRGEFKRYVLRDDCHEDMTRHCTKIEQLENDLTENRERIASLESKAEVWHGNAAINDRNNKSANRKRKEG